ncbi:unnamed protein product [Urochloa humidicola]
MQGAGTSLSTTFCALARAASYSSSRPLLEELGLSVAVLAITSRGCHLQQSCHHCGQVMNSRPVAGGRCMQVCSALFCYLVHE